MPDEQSIIGRLIAAIGAGGSYGAIAAASSSPVTGASSLLVSTGLAPVSSFTNVSGVGAGLVLDNGVARAHHSLVVITGPGVTGGVVTLQGSHDATFWFNTAAAVTTNAASAVFAANLANFPFRYIRAMITTAIVGGVASAQIASAG